MISRRTCAPFICMFVLAILAVAQSQTVTMSPEETTVRTTYAKLAYAVQLGAIHEALQQNPNLNGDQLAKAIAPKEMTFKLSNLTTGRIAEIENRNYADFVTPPGGWTLHMSSVQFTYTPEEGKSGEVSEWNAQGNWRQERDGSTGWDRLLIKEVMRGNHDTSTRYAAVTVTVSYLGHSRAYNSLWFFGGPSIIPVDLVVGNGILGDFAAINDVLPHTLLEAKPFASSPGVRSWLQTHQLADVACTGKAACCLPSTGQCGVTPTAASASFAKFPLRTIPTPPATSLAITPLLWP
jgi:hypothetical protein